MRSAKIERNTAETQVRVLVNVDGTGKAEIDSGVGFFNHMLQLFAVHSGMDVTVHCKGDTEVDFHHSVEDVGIALGEALKTGHISTFRRISRARSAISTSNSSRNFCARSARTRGSTSSCGF